jgi:[ribosomal protein S18]-alanine N-acetyltransferase
MIQPPPEPGAGSRPDSPSTTAERLPLPLAHVDVQGRSLLIRPLSGSDEADACARMMSGSEPWVTLGRDLDSSRAVIVAPDREAYVALDGTSVAGFIVINMRGAFTGYIQSVAVRDDWRSRGLGRRLIAFAEDRIFRETPNVFLCVSSFNPRARALYERLGYEFIGELRDFVVAGHSEYLMRKTRGPLRGTKGNSGPG